MRREWRQDAKLGGGIICLSKTLKVFRLFSDSGEEPSRRADEKACRLVVSAQTPCRTSLDFLATAAKSLAAVPTKKRVGLSSRLKRLAARL